MNNKHLIFLHGALGCKQHWDRFLLPFEDNFIVHNLNFPLHGHSPETIENYSYQSLTTWLKNYILRQDIGNFSIIGYSLGGYIGLNLIKENLQGYDSLITLATKLNWNPAIAAMEGDKLTLEKLSPILNKLKEEHSELEKLLEATGETLFSIGENPIEKSQFTYNKLPITMLSGSKDRMVTAEEITLFKENTSFIRSEIIENQPHSIERMDVESITPVLIRLLTPGNEIFY